MTKRTTKIKTQNREVSTLLGVSAYASAAIAPSAYPLTVIEAAGVSAVRRCVTLIANAIAGQKWTEWEDGVQITPASRIVQRPAASITRREWTWRVIASMALEDISYLFMRGGVDDEGVPGSIIPLPKIAVSVAGYADPYGIFPPVLYNIQGLSGTVSGEYIIPVRSAFWPGVPPHLQGILQMARDTLMSAKASDTYAARYWQSGGSPTTVITTEQELTNQQADTIGERWQTRRSKGPDFPAVFGKGAKANPWGADIGNALAVEARRDITVDIANLFGVPARYLNVVPVGQSQTYANLNDEALSLERFTLSGFVDPIQDAITDLLPDAREMIIDMSKLTRAGQESRFRAWQIATGKPWMKPSEVRALEGMPPDPSLDETVEASTTPVEPLREAETEEVVSESIPEPVEA